ncbi:hypothetical protein [Maribellus sp. YY47]|uniref:hypothetical protein n=1 Tax=Maribellus sp. YY47 TaxID=2929486 RepID=UPI0020015831|nr:hypothetical protein [Maribellus sp. YY47]MCK3685861.1 hypothetical protein [Maribellus sp. YY47]
MKLFVGLFVLMSTVLSSFAQDDANSGEDIVIENELFKLTAGSDGTSKSLVLKATNEECLIEGENIPMFSVTQERPYHNEIKLAHPNKKMTFQANSLKREGAKLIVGFELVPYDAVIRIKETADYISFTFEDFIVEPGAYPGYMKITPPPTTELCFLQLPVKNREHFGEWLNVSWDEKVAVNLLGTAPETRIDSEKRKGYRILKAEAEKEIKLKGVEAALIVCPADELLDKIARIEEDYNLPKGVKSRRDPQTKLSYYWTQDVNPGTLQQHLKYAAMGGFHNMMIYYPSFIDSWGYRKLGDYDWNRKLFPNGKEDVKKMLTRIEGEGIVPGFHFLHSHIGRDSRYVTPKTDHRLNLLRHFTLSEPLGESDTVVFVEQNPLGTTMADGCRVLRMGHELISYKGYTTTRPYKFTGCVRGIDKTTIGAQPEGYIFGLLDVSEFGATSIYVDQNSDLQDEIAEKLADIYDAGFKSVYFDGSEGVNPPFWYHVAAAQYRVFSRLNPEPLFAEGAAKTHFSWHMLSGGNAFDVFAPEILKEETRKWPAEEAPRMQEDFTRINFGWLGYFVPSENTVGTQPDMLEFVTSRAAAWDCPVSLHASLQKFEAHARTPDNLEVLRRWEEVRVKNWLTDEQKHMLRNLEQEHILLLNEQKELELLPYDQIENVAGSSKEIRAFTFLRGEDLYVVYWHISGNKKLELPLKKSNVQLFENLGEKGSVETGKGVVIVPAGNRRYLKVNKLSREELEEAFLKARILD